MKIRKRSLFIFVLIFLSFLLSGCKAEEEEESKKEILEAADSMVEAVNQSLIAKNQENEAMGLSDEQLALIKASQSAAIRRVNLESSEETMKIAVGIVRGTLIALGNYTETSDVSGDASGDETADVMGSKVEVVKAVSQKVMEILKESGVQSFSDAMGTLFAEIVSNLGSAGVTQTDLIAAIGELSIGVLTHAASIGVDAEVIVETALSLAKSAAGSLGSDGAGLLGKLVPQAMENMLPAIMEGMKEAGVSNDDIVDKIAEIIDAAAVALGDIPDLHPEDLGLSVKNVEKGVNKGLEKMGLTNEEIVAQRETIDNAINAAAKKLADKDGSIVLSDKVLTMSAEAPAELIENISLALFSVDSTTGFQLSEEQIEDIKKSMESRAATADDLKLETIIPLVLEGAKSAIDDISPALSETEKIDSLKATLEASVAFLGGKVVDEQYGDKNLSDSLKIIAENAVNPLLKDITGDPKIFQEIAGALIEPLDLVPMGAASIADAARVIVEGIVSNIDETGLSQADQSAALNNALIGAVEAVQKGKLSLDELKTSEGQIAAGAVESLIANVKEELKNYLKAGDASADASADQILHGVVDEVLDAMKEAGALDVPKLADDIIEGALDALKEDENVGDNDSGDASADEALSTEQIAEALDKVAEGVKESLEEEAEEDDGEIDEDEKDEIEEAVKDMATKQDELLSALAPFGSPDLVLSNDTLSTMEFPQDTKSIGLALDAQPEKNVVVTVESKNTDEGIVDPASVTFTPDNWFEIQKVNVISQDEGKRDGNIEYSVVFSADTGIRKTVTVTNLDDDVVGLDITPNPQKKLYTTAYGGEATFKVRLKSEPYGNIEVYWAIKMGMEVDGKSPAEIIDGRQMIFAPANWNVYQNLVLKPADIDIPENISGSVSPVVIKSVHEKDADYSEVETVLNLMVLKALKLQKLDKISLGDPASATVKVTFKEDWTPDDALFYGKMIEDQSIDIKYADNQTRPKCLSTIIEVNGDDGDVEEGADNGAVEPPFNFSVYFFNTATDSADAAIRSWFGQFGVTADATTGVCSPGSESDVVVCSYAGVSTPFPITLLADSIFNPDGVGNIETCSMSFADTGANPPTSDSSLDTTTDGTIIRFQYDSVVEGSNEVIFKVAPETAPETIKTGFWVLDGWSYGMCKVKISASDTKGVTPKTGYEPYDSGHYLYIEAP